MQQFTVQYAKEEGGETHWPMVGRAFQDGEGKRITVKLDSLPIPTGDWDGRLFLYPVPEKKTGATR